jgi:hypothetical protein
MVKTFYDFIDVTKIILLCNKKNKLRYYVAFFV